MPDYVHMQFAGMQMCLSGLSHWLLACPTLLQATPVETLGLQHCLFRGSRVAGRHAVQVSVDALGHSSCILSKMAAEMSAAGWCIILAAETQLHVHSCRSHAAGLASGWHAHCPRPVESSSSAPFSRSH